MAFKKIKHKSKHTDSRNALDGNLPNSFLETGQARVHFTNLRLLALYQLLDDLKEIEMVES